MLQLMETYPSHRPQQTSISSFPRAEASYAAFLWVELAREGQCWPQARESFLMASQSPSLIGCDLVRTAAQQVPGGAKSISCLLFSG